ncbi:S-adenosyl-L-methionine-dependent methyltransferase [Microdochium trichocladiopsis]|uniref:S-adenosyl-L-methionine-dependent methyltransferase n=1 Tax=Microdochium trichocladiopsis TaxID=1682393 RepID=A0A9P8Y335_9PEZI|nr:S-adenosyl-L-methionine-dependent methyltransferase [Microdochium trichocladiopsis]KAH7027964.1 S-adenosyl-L-methionine-dependent methyltransferase [Microdochium trichocladiopsis]
MEGQEDFIDVPEDIRNYVEEGNFRFHAYQNASYAFPNDDTAQSVEDERYVLGIILCEDRLHLAPVASELSKPGARVLDLGTGTGLWAMDMGDHYPHAEIIGVDISPIQPTLVPENVMFLVADMEQDFDGEDESYDFIHARHTLECVVDPAGLLSKIYRLLKPGGYVEFHGNDHIPQVDDDGTLPPNTSYAVRELTQLVAEGVKRYSKTEYDIIAQAGPLVAAAGFESVTSEMRKLPLGLWPQDLRMHTCGFHALSSFMRGMRGLCARTLGPEGLGWTAPQIEAFLTTVRRDAVDPRFHAWFPYHVVYARKPL